MSQYIDEAKNYFYGNETEVVYPEDTLPPQDCEASMHKEISVYWDLIWSMLALFFVTILLPYIFFCCRNKPRIVAKVYGLSGMVNVVIGILLSTVLMPQCDVNCGKYFCGNHMNNPGPVYGCVVTVIGVLWWCKACSLRRQAKRQELEDAALKAEGAAAPKEDGSNDIV